MSSMMGGGAIDPLRAQAPILRGLDGIRAIAVLAVILFHSDLPGLAPGGFLGVDIFFTLSGFLITALLVREFNETRTIDIRAFYVRRLRRLAPALVAVIVAAALVVPWWAPDALRELRTDIPAALLYVSNWWQLLAEQSYFERFGRPALLQHLWSLAIEEQFYLIWPIVALAVLKRFGPRALSGGAAALALLVTGWMGYLALRLGIPAEADPNRLYLATDTHAMGLLAGACLGCLWNPWRGVEAARSVGVQGPAGGRAVMRDVLGLVGLLGLGSAVVHVNEAQPGLYRGGFLLVSAMTLLVIVAAADRRTLLSTVLGLPGLRWVGERSYGLYLWHWPVFVLLRPGQELTGDPALAFAVRLGVTVLLTELSFRFIENPVRRGSVANWAPRHWAAVAGVLMAGLGALATPYRGSPPQAPLAGASVAGTAPEGIAAPPAVPVVVLAVEDRAPDAPPPGSACDGVGCAALEPASASLPVAATPSPGPVAGERVVAEGHDAPLTAIGDSVLLGTRSYLPRVIAGAEIDAQVGRQGHEGLRRIRELKTESKLADVVVLHLGTNGYLQESQVRDMLTELGDRQRVIVVNVHAARRWASINNALLQRETARHENSTLVNWDAAAKPHPEYFVADGVHLSSEGIRAFVELVRRAGGFPAKRRKVDGSEGQATASRQMEGAGGAHASGRRGTGRAHPSAHKGELAVAASRGERSGAGAEDVAEAVAPVRAELPGPLETHNE